MYGGFLFKKKDYQEIYDVKMPGNSNVVEGRGCLGWHASLNTILSEHMTQPAYNLCGLQVESDEARRHLYFHWSVSFYFYLG
jgi:hypothetical protein